MSFKFGAFIAGSTIVAATVAYFVAVPPVQSQEPRSASEFGGETSMNWYISPRDSVYPWAPQSYQYRPASLSRSARYVVPKPLVKRVYIYRRAPCRPLRRQMAVITVLPASEVQ